MWIEPTPEQAAAQAKWVQAVCDHMRERFTLEEDSGAMAMVRMMAEVSALGLFCRCGAPSTSVCFNCIEKGASRGVQTKETDGG